MPTQVFEIASRLDLSLREVLTKARELGIREARVPSSPLDDATADLLEHQLRMDHPLHTHVPAGAWRADCRLPDDTD